MANGVVINYEDAPSYLLTLHADTNDTTVTEDVRVAIKVLDDPNERLAVTMTTNSPTLTPRISSSVVFTGTVTGAPVPTSELSYEGHAESPGGEREVNTALSSPSWTVTESSAGTRKYWMYVSYLDEHGIATSQNSNEITLNWQAQ